MAFFKKLKDRLFKSSSKIEDGLDAIVGDGGVEEEIEAPVDTTQADAEAAARAQEAEAAQAAGDAVIMGAPNVVRGGSHNGNLSALDLIVMGYCDAIASDYHYPSPRRAALMLAEAGVAPMADIWHLVSGGPAALLGLTDRGVLEAGKRADLVILDRETRLVEATLSNGVFTYLTGETASRLTNTP